MAKISGIDVPTLTWPEAAAPGTPASGKVVTYAKTDGKMYSKDDAGVETLMSAGAGSAALVGASVIWTNASNYTRTGSTTFADVDATNLSHTITTGAHRVQIGAAFSAAVASTGQFMMIDFTVDSTRLGSTDGLVVVSNFGGAGLYATSLVVVTPSALSAASHTFRLQFAVGNASHTGTIFATSALSPVSFWVNELPW